MGLILCVLAFGGSLLFGRRSLAAGVAAVLTTGYLYGILRANYLDSFAHFIFDCAVLGLYLSRLGQRLTPAAAARTSRLWLWAALLIGWPCVMFLIPFQHPLIQLVGLRGNAFLLPFLLVGGRLQTSDANRLGLWLAALNLVALSVAGAEYVQGVPRYFPKNAVTDIIYKSKDLVGYTAYRIPATFSSAHSFAGTMVMTIPWMIGAWLRPGRRPAWQHVLLAGGIGAAVLGIFMAATRVNVILLFVLLAVITLSGKLRGPILLGWLVILGVIGYVVSGQERLQRFTTLGDTEEVVGRFEGSVNNTFLELVVKYPLGNGIGGGGTSIPFFLAHLIRDPVGMENEYSRIVLEQGWPGLLLWVGFILWVLGRYPTNRGDSWLLGKRLIWMTGIASFLLSLIGTGMLTSVPQTAMLLIGIGFVTAGPAAVTDDRRIRDHRQLRRSVHVRASAAIPAIG
jgi:hypothetical protein